MNLQEIKEKFTAISEMDGVGLNVYFLLKVNGEQTLKRADIIENVKENLIKSYKNTLDLIVSNEELALINLSDADDRINAFYEYNLEDKPSVFDFFETIRNQDLQPSYFSFDEDSLSDLEGYFVYFGDHENNIIMYRKQMAVNLFKQGKIYLIKDHETVLDFTMGSGTTMLACKKLGRNGIGIEKELNYFNIAKDRVNGKT